MRRENGKAWATVLGAIAVLLSGVLFVAHVFQTRFAGVLAVFVDRVGTLLWAGAVLLAALGGGCFALRRLGLLPKRPGAAALFGLGAGLGIVSLLTLFLGVLGVADFPVLLAVLAVMAVAGLPQLRRFLPALVRSAEQGRRGSWFRVLVAGVIAFFVILNLVRAFTPPSDYDSLEYHLAAPAAYHQAGRVFFIRDNVYANFPQNAEMLHFLGMRLTRSVDRGAAVGMALCGLTGLLAALAAGCMVSGLAGRDAGAAAAAIFYTWPGVTAYAGMGYVELPLIFYATLAAWAVVWAWRRKRTKPGPAGWIALGGIATGLALGVKYTAALLVLVPLGVSVFVLTLTTGRKLVLAVKRSVLFGAVALALFAPWLLRSTINTGNPVYPLLHKVFRSSHWSDQQDARWTTAHSPKDLSLARLGTEVSEVYRVGYRNQASVLLFLFVPFLLLAQRRRRGAVVFLLVLAVSQYVLWFYFTQQNERFMEAGVTVLAALSAMGLGEALRTRFGPALKPLVLVLLLAAPGRRINYVQAWNSADVALGATARREFLTNAGRSELSPPVYGAMAFLNDPERSPVKVMFLGEARPYYCRRDYIAPTVFDRHPIEGVVAAARTPEDIGAALKERGVTHILVNSAELARLQESYRYRYKEAARLGMLDGFDWGLFHAFLGRHARIVWPREAPGDRYDWSAWPAFIADYTTERTRPVPPQGHIVAVYELEP